VLLPLILALVPLISFLLLSCSSRIESYFRRRGGYSREEEGEKEEAERGLDTGVVLLPNISLFYAFRPNFAIPDPLLVLMRSTRLESLPIILSYYNLYCRRIFFACRLVFGLTVTPLDDIRSFKSLAQKNYICIQHTNEPEGLNLNTFWNKC